MLPFRGFNIISLGVVEWPLHSLSKQLQNLHQNRLVGGPVGLFFKLRTLRRVCSCHFPREKPLESFNSFSSRALYQSPISGIIAQGLYPSLNTSRITFEQLGLLPDVVVETIQLHGV